MQSRPSTVRARILFFGLNVFRPLLLLLWFVSRAFYKTILSWWLNPLLNRRFQKAFADEIKQAAPLLFVQYTGKVIPAPRPEVLEPFLSHVTIAVGHLIFQFSRWRSESYAALMI